MKISKSQFMYDADGGRVSRRSNFNDKGSVISLPRLVVSDAVSATKVLVAKTRSEVNGLSAFLRSMNGAHAETE